MQPCFFVCFFSKKPVSPSEKRLHVLQPIQTFILSRSLRNYESLVCPNHTAFVEQEESHMEINYQKTKSAIYWCRYITWLSDKEWTTSAVLERAPNLIQIIMIQKVLNSAIYLFFRTKTKLVKILQDTRKHRAGTLHRKAMAEKWSMAQKKHKELIK